MKLSSKTCTVLASIGVVGSVGLTAYATYRITTKLAQLKASHQPTKKEVVKVVAKEAVAPAILTASTLCAVTGAHVIDVKENAALMASYTALRRSYDKYGASVKRALGIDANKEVSKEYIAMSGTPKKDIPKTKAPESELNTYWVGFGFDDYFKASSDDIERAEAYVNKLLRENKEASVADFLDALDLEPNKTVCDFGWGKQELFNEIEDGWLRVDEESYTADNGEEIIALCFSCIPSDDYVETSKWFDGDKTCLDRSVPFDGPYIIRD